MSDLVTTLREADSLEECIGIAVGAASMCWETPEGAGIFDSLRASLIVDTLVDIVRGYVR